MTEKNFELLRPFDLESAKAGDKFFWINMECEFLGISKHPGGVNGGATIRAEHDGGMSYVYPNEAKAYPLCWVEGRPVYKGDVLYMTTGYYVGKPFVPHQFNGFMLISELNDTTKHRYRPEYLTWTPPKVKREGWINIYPKSGLHHGCAAQTSHAFQSKEIADWAATAARITCIHIEWEEDVKEAA